jgi:hypothetical protein
MPPSEMCLVDGMLAFNPSNRLTLDQCLASPVFALLRDPASETIERSVLRFPFVDSELLTVDDVDNFLDVELKVRTTRSVIRIKQDVLLVDVIAALPLIASHMRVRGYCCCLSIGSTHIRVCTWCASPWITSLMGALDARMIFTGSIALRQEAASKRATRCATSQQHQQAK